MFVRRRYSLLALLAFFSASCGSKEDAEEDESCALEGSNCDGTGASSSGGGDLAGTGGSGPAGTGGSFSGTGGASVALPPRPGVVVLRGQAPQSGSFEFELLVAQATAAGRDVSGWNTWESWPTDFSAVGLAVLFLHGEPFTTGQVQDLASVMEAGGTVIVLNEWSYYAQTDNLNALLTSLGTTLRFESGSYLEQVAPATTPVGTLGTHSLLEGVSAVRVAASSAIIGCNPTNLIGATVEGVCLIAAESRGLGQLIVSGDTNVLDDNGLETSSPSENPAFLANILASLPPIQ